MSGSGALEIIQEPSTLAFLFPSVCDEHNTDWENQADRRLQLVSVSTVLSRVSYAVEGLTHV